MKIKNPAADEILERVISRPVPQMEKGAKITDFPKFKNLCEKALKPITESHVETHGFFYLMIIY